MSPMLNREHTAKCILVAALICALPVSAILGMQTHPGHTLAVTSAAVKTERVLIAVEGMSCTSCASGIKAMLKRTPGVVSAEVSFERREAVVDYEAEQTSPEKIVEAITKLGYKASVKR